ncbi:MAG: relaxase/mobilization nuclease domain-containing protein [Mailhella sp.]|nr:relaxase/mobilization nuclease domain-containing protein [Mailhella sp.]
MYMKVFPHGKGGGHAPTHYLVRMDYPGRKECPPQVLRGNVALTRKLIDSLDTTWKFTAGVLSWHPDDIVTPEQERKVMDSFEAVAFAGLEDDQRNILWVRHGHAGHPELHFVIPRVELGSGKAFNPCPPGWQKAFDIFRDLLNITEGWASPDDPARARIHTPDHADLHKARLIRWGRKPDKDERADAKNAIHDYLRSLIEEGLVRNREDVLAALRDAGLEIHRTGKDYVSVKDPDSDEKLRLKGGIYAERFEAEQLEFTLRAYPSPSSHRQAERTDADTSRVQHLAEELERVIHARAQFNRKRYPRPDYDMEKKISGRCQSMGNMFSRPYRIALLWSFGMLTMTGLIIAGMIALAQYQIQALENEIAALKKVETLQTLAKGTWPILMEETAKGKFLTPLKSHTLESGWTYKGMPAWKLE